jgi:hypothetical protein
MPGLLMYQSPAPESAESQVMIVGVSHDDSVMGEGLSRGRSLPPGKANVEPIAWLTPSGHWEQLRCTIAHPNECKRFDREYLGKAHEYAVVSADGYGATVQVPRMELDHECFGIYGKGTFTGDALRYAAVAAEKSDFFAPGEAARRMPQAEAAQVRQELKQTVGEKLDSTKDLRVYSVRLEGRELIVVQRAFQDFANKYKTDAEIPDLEKVFAIGERENGRFHLLHWKENTSDESEQILGLIHLRAGKDFLVTSTSDPESDWFTAYGIRDGKLTVVFKGGRRQLLRTQGDSSDRVVMMAP